MPIAPKHRSRRSKRERKFRSLYGRKWLRCRRAYLAEHPVCVDCAMIGITKLAEDVHHVRRVSERPDLVYEPSNLMSLCHRCHSVRTQRGE